VQHTGALRYTPAGLPALDLGLAHESTLSEAGHPRQVRVNLNAVGLGEVVWSLQGLALGSQAQFAGFLAASRNGKGLVFHITEVQPLPAAEPAAGASTPAP
jgi:primosomal replication protein N